MFNKAIVFFLRILLILMGLNTLGFQVFALVFGTMIKSSIPSNQGFNEWNYYIWEFIPHIFTIFICIWFIVFQIRSIRKILL
jgi:hypothetical protein